MKVTPEILLNARAQLGYTQAKVAELIGVTTRAYGCYEDGSRNPKFATAKKLVEVLKLGNSLNSTIGTNDTKEDTIADRAIIQVIYNNLARVMAETYKITLEEALKRLDDDTVLQIATLSRS